MATSESDIEINVLVLILEMNSFYEKRCFASKDTSYSTSKFHSHGEMCLFFLLLLFSIIAAIPIDVCL